MLPGSLQAAPDERPNFVWFMAEDVAKHFLSLYNEHGVVSFMDFGPTLLHLAGLKIPDQMDGTPFLGKELTLKRLNRRNSVFCYGDRFDELYAFN